MATSKLNSSKLTSGASSFLFVACFGLALPREAAASPNSRGVEIGIRTGPALAVGTVQHVDSETMAPLGKKISDTTPAQGAFHFDFGLRLVPRFFIGGTLTTSVGPGSHGVAKCGGANPCAVSTGRIGLLATLHARPRTHIDPWLGFGPGLSYLRRTRDVDGTKTIQIASGTDFDLLAGVDFRIFRRIALGPYASAKIGSYGRIRQNSERETIADRSVHVWFSTGFRFALIF
jgi:hypothetical protein